MGFSFSTNFNAYVALKGNLDEHLCVFVSFSMSLLNKFLSQVHYCVSCPSTRKRSVLYWPPSGGTQQQSLRRTSSHIFLLLWRRHGTRSGSSSPPFGDTVTHWLLYVCVTPVFSELHLHLLLQRHLTVLCGVLATRGLLSWLSWVKHWQSYARQTW